MSLLVATWLVRLLGMYLLLGVAFALYFVTRGVAKVDHSAQEATLGFRLLIFPGTVALWPLLLRRVLRGTGTPPEERTPHREAARVTSSEGAS